MLLKLAQGMEHGAIELSSRVIWRLKLEFFCAACIIELIELDCIHASI